MRVRPGHGKLPIAVFLGVWLMWLNTHVSQANGDDSHAAETSSNNAILLIAVGSAAAALIAAL